MDVQFAIGELLYIGFVAEKGRSSMRRWGRRYKNTLRNHMRAMSEINLLLFDSSNIDTVLQDFMDLCVSDPEIGKFYHFSSGMEGIIWENNGNDFPQINQFMKEILEELLEELSKRFVNKNRVYHLLRILHNLPRVYLTQGKSLCNLQQKRISERDALRYAYQNMNVEDQEKYKQYLKCINE